jgi:ribonuclease T2
MESLHVFSPPMSPDSKRKTMVLVTALVVVLVAWISRREAGESPAIAGQSRENPAPKAAPAVRTTFDFYLMALTVHAAYCADHARERECRVGAHRPLVIHGLWPERNEPRTYPHDCPAPPLDLDPALALQLRDFMPGMADDLHEHEWRSHGGCSGLDDDEYFARALELARGVDAALSAKLTTLAGRDTDARELREIADAFHPGLGVTLTFHCRTLRDAPAAQGREPYLVEVRQCVDNDGRLGGPGTPLDCAALKRRDTGCGKSFRIAGAGR